VPVVALSTCVRALSGAVKLMYALVGLKGVEPSVALARVDEVVGASHMDTSVV
jgi:hypothetical protein